MWSTASTTAIWTTIASSTGSIIFTVVSAVVVVAVGLMGVGFGLRKVKKYVTGKKF